MVYQISRGGQTYGPYTLADLKRYVESGHVLLSDMAKGDEMPEWVTVSSILNPSSIPPVAPPEPVAAPAYQTAYAPQPTYAPVSQFPDPPNLHWGVVLLIDVVTGGLFQIAWNIILSLWMKKVNPGSQAVIFYFLGEGLQLWHKWLIFPLYMTMLHGSQPSPHLGLSLLWLVAWALRLMARFNMKNSLEEHFNTVEPIGFRMSAVLTFFFGGLYIQSQLNRINEIKQAMHYQQFGR